MLIGIVFGLCSSTNSLNNQKLGVLNSKEVITFGGSIVENVDIAWHTNAKKQHVSDSF